MSAYNSIPSLSREQTRARHRPEALAATLRRRKSCSSALGDPDAEAFCRIYARVVLRIKGLVGLPKPANAREEVERESA